MKYLLFSSLIFLSFARMKNNIDKKMIFNKHLITNT